jgi:hypothetical protein
VLGLPACSEYSLKGGGDAVAGLDSATPEEAGTPNITATPASIHAAQICGSEAHEVRVKNAGSSSLRLKDAVVEGSGWSVDGPDLPLSLAPGTAALFTATGTDGEATLTFLSNDPDEPELAVTLAAFADQAPAIHINRPINGSVLASEAEVQLRGSVSDVEDDAEDLIIVWSSSQDGPISTAPAAPDGSIQVDWPAAGRSPADHTLTLTATDTCGNTSLDSVSVCQQELATYDELDLVDWHFEGVSRWDVDAGWLELTSPETYVVGSAFETGHLVNGGAVEVDLMFYIGDGTGADGISITALDTDRYGGVFLGGDGCGIGFGGGADCTPGPALPGWSIEIDTHYNSETPGFDPTSDDHAAFYFDGDLSTIQAWSALPDLEDTGWHNLRVMVAAPHVLVVLDGATVIDVDLDGHFDFNAWLGFTAGTGGQTNYHLIDSLEITELACEE